TRNRADIGDVLPVRGHNQRRPRSESGEQAGRDEEVGVDDIGPEAARGGNGESAEPRVFGFAAGTGRQHHALDRVAARLQRLLEAAHEDAVVRLGVARIHLRDQQDPHRGILAGRAVHRFGTVLAPRVNPPASSPPLRSAGHRPRGEGADSMKTLGRRIALGVAAATTGIFVFVAAGAAFAPHGLHLTNVPTPNTRSDGVAPAAKLSPELQQIVWAQGSTKLENPSTLTSYYGYDNDTLNAAGLPKMVPTSALPNPNMEAHKTEPDKNTYLVFKHGHGGPDSSYDYGTHFLFQGHEGGPADPASGPGNLSYITRINLDADAAHRVTLYPTTAGNGKPLITIDGSTWAPWAKKLLFTTENQNGPSYAADASWPSTIDDVSGSIGRGGYEGIQNDSDGNLWIDEDIGSPTNKPAPAVSAKFPNSFVFRFVPKSPSDLTHGKLEALQVLNESNQPITFASQSPHQSPDQIALHTYGKVFKTNWVTVHDTAVDGTTSFNANLAAK